VGVGSAGTVAWSVQTEMGWTGATAAETGAYAAGFPELAKTQHFRKLKLRETCLVSSLGLGTYLGEADEATDDGYAAALRAALGGGINLIDTASNYRHQRSERVIGKVLAEGTVRREQVVVCSKAGFIVSLEARDQHLRTGLIRPGEIVGDWHCMAPVYLAHQLERSLENLGLEAVDVYYLHNPETQQAELSREEFYRRLRGAFELLERQAGQGRIGAYGVATWSGLRVPPDAGEYLDLNRMVATAREVAGEGHHFRFVQMPYNLAMPEAYTLLNQTVEKPPYVSTLNAAFRLGLQVIASASLMNGRLQHLPEDGRAHVQGFLPAAATDVELALQFVRSTSGVLAGLVGMARPEHVAENLRAAAVAPAAPAVVGRLLGG